MIESQEAGADQHNTAPANHQAVVLILRFVSAEVGSARYNGVCIRTGRKVVVHFTPEEGVRRPVRPFVIVQGLLLPDGSVQEVTSEWHTRLPSLV